MAEHFHDTSAAVKHYRNEPGTARVDALLADTASRHYLSTLGVVEIRFQAAAPPARPPASAGATWASSAVRPLPNYPACGCTPCPSSARRNRHDDDSLSPCWPAVLCCSCIEVPDADDRA
jgi:hypothetical protein